MNEVHQSAWLVHWSGEITAATAEEAAQKAKDLITTEDTSKFLIMDSDLFLTRTGAWESFEATRTTVPHKCTSFAPTGGTMVDSKGRPDYAYSCRECGQETAFGDI